MGITAGQSTTGSRNFLAGKGAGLFLTQSDIIVIGDSSLSTGTAAVPITDANLRYSVIIGSQTGKALAAANSTTAGSGAAVLLGGNTLVSNARLAATVAIGASIFPNLPTTQANSSGQNVFVGFGIGQNVNVAPASNGFTRNTIIGGFAFQSFAGLAQDIFDNVIIGASACQNGGTNGVGALSGGVLIGTQCALNITNAAGATIIGYQAGASIAAATNTTCLGANTDAGANATANTAIGAGAQTGTGRSNTLVGAGTSFFGQAVAGQIVLGAGAGVGANSVNDLFLVETNYNSTTKSLFYGQLDTGNLLIGNTAGQSTVRAFGVNATNVLKLINGVKAATNPIGGGYFYVDSGTGALHWVGAAGTDTALAPS